ncbi:hypothetical protein L873DRAFT_1787013 [Choiromyces venosus 120613-1]|uniref:Uncharacterized protein n=1 Tax=Choiromyces venosus 120613-1 TaxID=1336337 RepID=A0A3N4K5B6_9PEZI|nr:hypothetical protein L873DRAFT_1787013 [Choiromyces venosus 120613-1]
MPPAGDRRKFGSKAFTRSDVEDVEEEVYEDGIEYPPLAAREEKKSKIKSIKQKLHIIHKPPSSSSFSSASDSVSNDTGSRDPLTSCTSAPHKPPQLHYPGAAASSAPFLPPPPPPRRSEHKLTQAKSILTHPRTTIKSSIARHLAHRLSTSITSSSPSATTTNPQVELTYLSARNALEVQQARGDVAGVEDAERVLQELKMQKRDMRVRWIMSRHVNMVLAPRRGIEKLPVPEDYYLMGGDGKVVFAEDGGVEVD